jgi:hypothetical protein
VGSKAMPPELRETSGKRAGSLAVEEKEEKWISTKQNA